VCECKALRAHTRIRAIQVSKINYCLLSENTVLINSSDNAIGKAIPSPQDLNRDLLKYCNLMNTVPASSVSVLVRHDAIVQFINHSDESTSNYMIGSICCLSVSVLIVHRDSVVTKVA
jgi:hypothetical protein